MDEVYSLVNKMEHWSTGMYLYVGKYHKHQSYPVSMAEALVSQIA